MSVNLWVILLQHFTQPSSYKRNFFTQKTFYKMHKACWDMITCFNISEKKSQKFLFLYQKSLHLHSGKPCSCYGTHDCSCKSLQSHDYFMVVFIKILNLICYINKNDKTNASNLFLHWKYSTVKAHCNICHTQLLWKLPNLNIHKALKSTYCKNYGVKNFKK